jgi:hypothetical protein
MLSDEERLTVVNVVASTRVAEELDLPARAVPGGRLQGSRSKVSNSDVQIWEGGLYWW